MTTALDTKLIPRIKSIVDRLGKTVTFTVSGVESYSPSTGETIHGDETEYSIKVTPPEGFKQRLIDSDLIQQGDVYCYLPASELAFTLDIAMKVTIDSVVWRIVRISLIYTGDLVGAYNIQLRR